MTKGRDRTQAPAKNKVTSAEMYIDALIPYARNARLHSEAQITKIANSIGRFGFVNPISVWRNNEIIAGHGRVLAAKKLIDTGKEQYQYLRMLPVRRCDHLTDLERRALAIADNKLPMEAEWDEAMLAAELETLMQADFEVSLTGFDAEDINVEDEGVDTGNQNTLADKFLIPPFSVFNAREGFWQDRKRAWIALGIRSEVGRGENASPGGSARPAMDYSKKERGDGAGKPMGKFGKTYNTQALTADPAFKRGKKVIPGGAGKNSAYLKGGAEILEGGGQTGTSIFDPVLCEIAYRWFSPAGGQVLDPFAGGSVRGIVAAKLGRNYFGVDLREEQIDANKQQAKEICKQGVKPQYVTGDSMNIGKLARGVQADLLFSCPPYADLEVYSEHAADISNMPYPKFREAYFEIIKKSCALLKNDRFAVWVIGEARDKKGNYYNLVGDTISAFKEAGLEYYNEAILVTSVGSLPLRVNGGFVSSRKLGKTHQNVLVFVKGSPKKATQACGEIRIEQDFLTAAKADSVLAQS